MKLRLIKFVLKNLQQSFFKTNLVISAFCSSLYSILLCYIPSALISLIESGFSYNSLRRIVILFLLYTFSFLVSTILDNQFDWYRFLAARFSFMPLHMKAKLYTPYNEMMNDETTQKENKAYSAISDNENGIEGFLHSVKSLLSLLISTVYFCGNITSTNPVILISIITTTILSYYVTCKMELTDKEKNLDYIRIKNKETKFYDSISTSLKYAKDIRLFSQKKLILDKYAKLESEIQKKRNSSQNLWIRNGIYTECLVLIQNLVIFLYLTNKLLDVQISIADYTLLISFATVFSSNIQKLLTQISIIKKQLSEILDFYIYVSDTEQNQPKTLTPISKSNNIFCFHNVCYKYPFASKNTLSDINIELKTNDIISLVGLNGAGKTTFVKILTGLLEPTKGYITLNGIRVNSLDRQKYFSYFSPVFQDSRLFAFTIQENVSLRNKQDTDLQKIQKSLCEAKISETINHLPLKTDTYINKSLNKDGVDFSGGEKQHISLARALYKDAPIFVLDEPTSALDPIAENQFYREIYELIKGKNENKHYLVIFISHRMASSSFADQILFFKNGIISENGTHEKLMNNRQDYYHLYEMQKKYYMDNTNE